MAGTHAGHRDRLRERARENLEGFQPHEVLELLLFYTIPRRDTNSDGHRLVEAFGSAGGAIFAPPGELLRVPGIGEKSAKWLKSVGKLVQAYRDLTCQERPMLGNVRLTSAFLKRYFPRIPGEGAWMISLTAEGRLLLIRPFAKRETWATREALVRALSGPLRLHAHSVVLLQFCRGDVKPTAEDVQSTRRVAEELCSMNAHLLDHLLYDGEVFYSMFAHGDLNGADPRDQIHNPLREHYLDDLELPR